MICRALLYHERPSLCFITEKEMMIVDYQLFDDLEKNLEEQKSLLLFDKILSDIAPERSAQHLLAQIIAEEEESFARIEQLYHSLLKQNYIYEERPGPQIMNYEDGLRTRLLREISSEQSYGEQFARAVDAAMRRALFEQFCASLCRVQRFMYLLLSAENTNKHRQSGV